MKTILLGFFLMTAFLSSTAQFEQLDPSFGDRGVAFTNAGSLRSYARRGVTLLPTSDEGYYYFTHFGELSFVSKRNANGSVQTSFGINGSSDPLPLFIQHAALQADGKVLLAGNTSRGSFMVARLTTDGLPDSSFSEDGFISGSFASFNNTLGMGVQPDGSIVLGVLARPSYTEAATKPVAIRYSVSGIETALLEMPFTDTLLAHAMIVQNNGKVIVSGTHLFRLTADLLQDPGFNGGTPLPLNGGATALAVQADNKILVSGYNNANSFEVRRFTEAGLPDPAFNGTGVQSIAIGGDDHVTSMEVSPTGKTVLAGRSVMSNVTSLGIVRLNADGSPDLSFSGDGIIVGRHSDRYNEVLQDLLIDDNENITLIGFSDDTWASASPADLLSVRYLADGLLDSGFGTGGVLVEPYNNGATAFLTTTIQTDGRAIAAGYTWNGTGNDMIIARYTAGGHPDSSFSSDGILIDRFGSGSDSAKSIRVQADGKILLAGSSGNKLFIARYNPDGSVDNSFNGDGNIVIDNGGYKYASSLLIQPDGKLLVVGSALYRFNADGTPDATFGGGDGVWQENLGNIPFKGAAIALYPDGKIVVGGYFLENFVISVHNPDGSLFAGFKEGVGGNNGGDYNGEGYSSVLIEYLISIDNEEVLVQPDGKVIIAGIANISSHGQRFQSTTRMRFHPDGRRDLTYNQGIPVDMLVSSMVLQPDGKIVFGGTGRVGNFDGFIIFRSNTDGTPDLTYSEDGLVAVIPKFGNSQLGDMAIYQNRLFAAGTTQSPNFVGVVAKLYLPMSSPLPVTLTELKATARETTVLLQWKTASEINFDGFEVQRSSNGVDFFKLGFVTAKASGNTAATYILTDHQPNNGINYYRLQMRDKDGTSAYSTIVTATIEPRFSVQLSPNPAKDRLYIRMDRIAGQASIAVLDMQGKTVLKQDIVVNGTPYPFDIKTLGNGVYHLRIITANTTDVIRFVKQ